MPDTKICEQCGNTFERKKVSGKNSLVSPKIWAKKRFCGYSCATKSRHVRDKAERAKLPRPSKTCAWCGEIFYRRMETDGQPESKGAWDKRLCCSISCGKKYAGRNNLIDPLTRYKVNENGCWIWQGPLSSSGYGTAFDDDLQGSTTAHRVIYKKLVGPIPEGLALDHLCEVKECVNPKHLEPVTTAENLIRMRRGIQKRRNLMNEALENGTATGDIESRGITYRVTISAERNIT